MHYIKFNKSQAMPMFRHCARQNEHYSNENIDPSRTHLNYNLAPSGNQWGRMMDRLKQLTYREQKNNIVLCGWVITSPSNLPEEKKKDFFKIMYDFMVKKYGLENIVSSYVHNDEEGPGHMHFLYVPGTKDLKLSASKTTTRATMQTIHDEAQEELDKYFNHQYLLRADNPEDRAKDTIPVEVMKKALVALEDKLNEAQAKLEEAQIEIDFAHEKINNQNKIIKSQEQKIKDKKATIQEQENEIQKLKDRKEMWHDIAEQYTKDSEQYKAQISQQKEKIKDNSYLLQELKNQSGELQKDIEGQEIKFNRYKAKNLKKIGELIKQIEQVQASTNDIQAIVELQHLNNDTQELWDR